MSALPTFVAPISPLWSADFTRDVWPHRNVKNANGGSLAIKKDSAATQWLKIPGHGFCGLHYSLNLRRLKAAYVFPEWRGRGLYRKMVEARLAMCEGDQGCQIVETITVIPSFFVGLGFSIEGVLPNGGTRMSKILR